MYPSTDAIHQEIRINSTSSCSLKLQVVSEGGIWAKLWLTHSVRAHFGSPESYHTSFISANYIIFTFMSKPILKVCGVSQIILWSWESRFQKLRPQLTFQKLSPLSDDLNILVKIPSVCVFVGQVDLQEKLVGGTFLKQQMHNFKSSYAESRPFPAAAAI